MEIEFLFGNHKFWENTMKKHGCKDKPLASILKKRDLVIVNLSQIHTLSYQQKISFDELFANALAHEIFHILIMDEVQTNANEEENIIDRIVTF